MFAALVMGTAAMVAAPVVNTGVSTDVNVIGFKPEYRFMQNSMPNGELAGDVVDSYTRSYNQNGNIWQVRIQLRQQPMCELLTFADKDGNPVTYTFDQIPYYCAVYTITRQKPDEEVYSTLITFNLAWPSKYIWQQVWNYDGILDEDGSIPVEYRDYSPVTVSELANNPDCCRIFKEATGLGAGDPEGEKWSYFSMLPNQQLGDPCLFDNQMGYTFLDETVASTVDFSMFDSEEDWLKVNNRLFVRLAETSTSRRIQCNYDGSSIIEGFTETREDVPAFGDLHLFNTGLMSSAAMGDNNPFPGDFDAMTAFFYMIGDKNLLLSVDPTATKFDPTKLVNGGLQLPEGENLTDHANYLKGYLFADAKYANDQNLNPEELGFSLQDYEEIREGEDIWYAYIVPEVGGMVPYGVGDMNQNMEPWSETYGFRALIHNMNEFAAIPSTLGWGYNKGFVCDLRNDFMKTFHIESDGKLFYHYDPKDMKLYRELALVGSKEYNSVESVAAENATVVAADGVITVVPAEDANVAVYTLDGICLLNVNANAGQTVAVEAQKGLYVVTVNGASKKVAL